MSELLIEVEEAIKRERLEHIWKTYGNLIIGVILAVILCTGFYSGYSGWKNEQAGKKTDILLAAEELDDPAKLIEARASVGSGLSSLATIKAAGEFLAKGEEDKAKSLYVEASANKDYPKEFRDLASFMAAHLNAKTDADSSLKALEKMAADAKNPFRYHAYFEIAILQAHVKQDFTKARENLAAILTSKDVPQSLSAKANALNVIYALKEKK